MPGATPRGYPYSLGSDPASTIDTTSQALAEKVNGSPGVSSLTTAERDALTGAELWDWRVIANRTSGQLERYSAGSAKWLPIFNVGTTVRDTHTFTIQGEVRVDNAANDFYVNPFFVEVRSGQTTSLVGLNLRLLSGSVDLAIDRRTAAGTVSRIGSYSATSSYTRSTLGLPVTLADRDTIHLVILAAAAGSKGLTASLAYDMSV